MGIGVTLINAWVRIRSITAVNITFRVRLRARSKAVIYGIA